jgi:ketosteroid isomerase-like protein
MAVANEMRKLVDQLYDSFSSGDAAPWASRTADDVIVIGTDPDEWWEGRDMVTSVVTAQLREMSDAGVRLVADDPRIYEHGDVLWSVDHPVLHLRDGTEVPMRVTLIAAVEEGVLRLKHGHYSVGAVNEETFGQELPTEEPSGRG